MDDRALANRLGRLYAGLLYDALYFDLRVGEPFVVDPAIGPARCQPLDIAIAGPAFTCGGAPLQDPAELDDLLRLRMLEAMMPGCVQVLATGPDATCAHFGDISGRLAAQHGAVGVVIDGNTRDVRRLAHDGFPTFCRGTTPVDAYGRWQVVRYQQDEVLPGIHGPVVVSPGDWIFADADGVLRIRAADVESALMASEERSRGEELIRSRLRDVPAIVLYGEVGRW